MSPQVAVRRSFPRSPVRVGTRISAASSRRKGRVGNKGLLAALGDGLGGQWGRRASEYTVRGLLCDYYATPDTWGVHRAIDKVLTAPNRWLLSKSARDPELAGMATTLSAVVPRRSALHTAHIGDRASTRVRGGKPQIRRRSTTRGTATRN